MKTSALVSTVILLAAASAPAHAQIYKWVDGNGTTHYSDKGPAGAKKLDTVSDRVSVYTPDVPVARAQAPAPATAALNDRVDRLEQQLYAERLARQQAELASYSQAQADAYVPYAVPVSVPIRHRHTDAFRPHPAPRVANVVGPGIMPGTFNGPNAITAGNVTLRTSVPAFRGRGATF
jgi:hypothetical protein